MHGGIYDGSDCSEEEEFYSESSVSGSGEVGGMQVGGMIDGLTMPK